MQDVVDFAGLTIGTARYGQIKFVDLRIDLVDVSVDLAFVDCVGGENGFQLICSIKQYQTVYHLPSLTLQFPEHRGQIIFGQTFRPHDGLQDHLVLRCVGHC